MVPHPTLLRLAPPSPAVPPRPTRPCPAPPHPAPPHPAPLSCPAPPSPTSDCPTLPRSHAPSRPPPRPAPPRPGSAGAALCLCGVSWAVERIIWPRRITFPFGARRAMSRADGRERGQSGDAASQGRLTGTPRHTLPRGMCSPPGDAASPAPSSQLGTVCSAIHIGCRPSADRGGEAVAPSLSM